MFLPSQNPTREAVIIIDGHVIYHWPSKEMHTAKTKLLIKVKANLRWRGKGV